MHAVMIISALLALGAAGPAKEELSDAGITARVESMFLIHKHLSPLNINTTTNNGIVTLTGSVDDEVQKGMALELTASIKGVRGVKNGLTVIGTVHGEKQKRSFKQRLKDKKITAAVRSRLVYNREFKGFKIGVDTVNGVVTLHGVVDTKIQKARIGQLATQGSDVVEVRNNLTVRPKEGSNMAHYIGRQFSDEWVESRVSTAILFNRHLSIRELDVEVDDGLCILTGTVDLEAQRELAGKVADSIKGVKKVQNDVRVRRTGPALEGVELEEAPGAP